MIIHSNKEIKPNTLEEKILFDSDKLDGVGAIGILRWAFVSSTNKKDIFECVKGYKKIIQFMLDSYGRLYTKEANLLLKKKLKFSKLFLSEIEGELYG